MRSKTRFRYFVSAAVLGLCALVAAALFGAPFFLPLLVTVGVAHAYFAAELEARLTIRHLLLETFLTLLAVGSVVAYALKSVQRTRGTPEHLLHIVGSELTSKPGLFSLAGYLTSWGILAVVASLLLGLATRERRQSLVARCSAAGLALAACNVLIRYTAYDPIREVGVWRLEDGGAEIAAMSIAALLEPLTLYLFFLLVCATIIARQKPSNETIGQVADSLPVQR